MRQVTFAATQFASGADNLSRAESLVREAASKGAQVILMQEFFGSLYFCQDQKAEHFALATPFEGNPLIASMARLAKELNVVLPVSFFERAGQAHFNSLAMLDAGGEVLGIYRKSHIPDGPGYQEKFYFNPGDTGFKVWETKFGIFGVGVCWDQWFPEAARAMALMGAEALLYPTAIGSEPPPAPPLDSRDHWRRVMQGHAAANVMPVIASNRVGTERLSTEIAFYGSSFISDQTGALVQEMNRTNEGVITASFDLDAVAKQRHGWGLFRDRRPDLYGALVTSDGKLTS
ncbi:MAG TPA: N-carbamoylputrescine amidase [Rhizomicrobium sp.]|nr:N-carbamoylputrescine amidase [Rhizomicrobium sp.]